MCAGKGSTVKELFSVAECPSHPSESLTSDTREANPAFSSFHLPTLTRTTGTCHTLVTWEDRGEEKWRNMVQVINWGSFTWESLLYRMVITDWTPRELQWEHADRLQIHDKPVVGNWSKATLTVRQGEKNRYEGISITKMLGWQWLRNETLPWKGYH